MGGGATQPLAQALHIALLLSQTGRHVNFLLRREEQNRESEESTSLHFRCVACDSNAILVCCGFRIFGVLRLKRWDVRCISWCRLFALFEWNHPFIPPPGLGGDSNASCPQHTGNETLRRSGPTNKDSLLLASPLLAGAACILGAADSFRTALNRLVQTDLFGVAGGLFSFPLTRRAAEEEEEAAAGAPTAFASLPSGIATTPGKLTSCAGGSARPLDLSLGCATSEGEGFFVTRSSSS
eukprot:scaffold6610_cov245-Pinguiococcus_pyrenoidosus.AAC.1